jgi:hypothetical protein
VYFFKAVLLYIKQRMLCFKGKRLHAFAALFLFIGVVQTAFAAMETINAGCLAINVECDAIK